MNHCNVNIWPGESPLEIYHDLSAWEIVSKASIEPRAFAPVTNSTGGSPVAAAKRHTPCCVTTLDVNHSHCASGDAEEVLTLSSQIQTK